MNKTLLFLLLLSSFIMKAQVYNFESNVVPSGFECINGGNISISTDKYKLGNSSLKWNWTKGSYLKISSPANLGSASKLTAGGISLFIYNPNAASSNLTFKFYSGSTLSCQKSFNLNYQGWRTFWNRFVDDMKHNKSELTQVRIYPPATGETGTIYFDLLEFSNSIPWSRMTDAQYSVVQSPSMEKFWDLYQNNVNDIIATEEEKEDARKVVTRTDEWFIGTNRYQSASEYVGRRNAINTWINTANRNFTNLNISRGEDGIVKGDGLFMMDYTSKIDNIQPMLFRNVSSNYMIQLAYDYRLKGSQTSLDRLKMLYDWFYDQGWAAGSAHGTLYFEKLRSGGYFNSLFMVRDQLDSEMLQRELETLRWYTLFGTALTIEEIGETADNLRTLLTPKLFYALMQNDENKRVSALRDFQNYCIESFSPNSAYFGTFKNDGLGGHHKGIYLGSYLPHALYTACQISYILHGTEFEMPESVLQHLKKTLLTYTDFCALYDVPTATNGRFPGSTQTLNTLIFAFPYLAKAMNDDVELVKAMRRLWKPESETLKKVINKASMSITFTSSLGEIETCLEALEITKDEEVKSESSNLYPFGALGIYRTEDSHVSIKSASKYVWDFESSGSSENPYGRYLGNGVVEITNMITEKKNPSFPLNSDNVLNNMFRWSRLSGATTIDLTNSELNFTSNGSLHRNFTDQSSVGGVCLNDTVAMYALSYHDQHFNNSFYYKTSYLRIGKAFFSLGSNIKNTGAGANTITTLFQTELLEDENIIVNGNVYNFDKNIISNPTIIDNQGTAYIVRFGDVRISKETDSNRTLVTCYIDHGLNPKSADYNYIFIPNATTEDISNWSAGLTNDFVVEMQSDIAHVVNYEKYNIKSYAIYNKMYNSENGVVKSVNTPSFVLTNEKSNGRLSVVLSDPDLRRPFGKNIDAISNEMMRVECSPFEYSCVLNGEYNVISKPTGFTVNIESGNTIISGDVSQGRSYKFELESKNSSVDINTVEDNFKYKYANGVLELDYKNNSSYDFSLHSITGELLIKMDDVKGFLSVPVFLMKGIYFFTIKDTSGSTTVKFIING